jgi:hypothetical protein
MISVKTPNLTKKKVTSAFADDLDLMISLPKLTKKKSMQKIEGLILGWKVA